MSDISIIIVNYGTPYLTIDAVESVRTRDHGGRHVDIHLVDNASPGEDAAIFEKAHADRAWGTEVTLYLEPQNHGFGRGNNVVLEVLAARAAPPQYVFLLNPDAQLENEALDILASYCDAHSNVAAAGAGIAFPNGTPVTAAFRFPTALSEFVQAMNFGPLSRRLSNRLVPLPPDHPEGPVDWVAGAAVLFRLTALQDVGFFDPDFFLYYEEVELMRRLKMAGYDIWYLPTARVLHAEGAATQVKSGQATRRSKPEYWYDSWRLYFSKCYGRMGALGVGMAWAAGVLCNLPVALLRGKPRSAPLHFTRDFFKFVMAPLLRKPKGSK